MAKIILPTYLTNLPSTGKQIKFRPFTVKEEKSLLLALQEDDMPTVVEAIKSVIDVCTIGVVDPEKTPYYDIEFLFLQIRSKSIGEIIDLVGSCECVTTAKTQFSVDIASVYIEPKPSGNAKIRIPDTNYTVEFRHPSIDDFSKTFNKKEDHAVEVVANCIVSVYTEDEVIDWTKEEKMEFVESMTTKQQKGIAEYLKIMPMVKLPTKYTCESCGKPHESIMTGFENFFV